MPKWSGSSGVCINENAELLMVLQGKPEETKLWSVPSGGQENNETFQECCIREMEEETGYKVEVVEELQVKSGSNKELNLSYEVHYFLVKVIGGERTIQDPDNLVYDIAWKTSNDLRTLELSFPEDRQFLLNCLQKYSSNSD